MRHPGIHQQDRESLRGVLTWLFAILVCFTVCAILTRERDWSYMLLMTSPYLALLICLLGLAAMGWFKRGKAHEQSSLPFPEAIVAAASEKFFVRSSECVQPDCSGITNEPTGSNITSITPNMSIDYGTPYYAIALAVSAWLWLLAAVPFLTDAACPFVAAGVLAVAWMFLALAWLWGLLAARSLLRSAPARYWWLSASLAGLLGLLLAFTDGGFLLRVMLSERALNAYVAAVPQGTENLIHSNRQVGLFLVDGTEERNGVVILYTSSSFLDRHGIAYVPDGAIPPSHLRAVKHLFGRWYSFQWHF